MGIVAETPGSRQGSAVASVPVLNEGLRYIVPETVSVATEAAPTLPRDEPHQSQALSKLGFETRAGGGDDLNGITTAQEVGRSAPYY